MSKGKNSMLKAKAYFFGDPKYAPIFIGEENLVIENKNLIPMYKNKNYLP